MRPLHSSLLVGAAIVAPLVIVSACGQTRPAGTSTPAASPATVATAEPAQEGEAASELVAEAPPPAEGDLALPPGSASVWNTAQSDGDAARTDRGLEDYRAIIANNRDKFRACYDTSLAAHPGIKGNVVLRFTLDTKGKVKEADIDKGASEITEKDLEDCMVKALQSLAFPPSKRGMESTVRYPFNFNPRARPNRPKQ